MVRNTIKNNPAPPKKMNKKMNTFPYNKKNNGKTKAIKKHVFGC